MAHRLDKINMKIDHNRLHVNQSVKRINKHLDEEIQKASDELKKLNGDTFSKMANLAGINRDSINKLTQRLDVEWKNSEKEFEQKILAFSKDCSTKTKNCLERTSKAREKIKNLCADFFTKNEKKVADIKSKVGKISQSFEEWKKYVMNPQSINEARIHSLDIKCDDIEKQVRNNFTIVYTVVKKLLFSLQQYTVAPKDHSSLLTVLNEQNKLQETKQLFGEPMDNRTDADVSSPTKNADLMLLKRIFRLQSELNTIAEDK